MNALREKEYEEEQESVVMPKERPHLVKGGLRGMLDKPMRSQFRTAFIIFTLLATAVTVRSAICANNGYALVYTQRQAQEIEQENARLRIEIAHLKSPHHVKTIAVEELGMEDPSRVYFGQER